MQINDMQIMEPNLAFKSILRKRATAHSFITPYIAATAPVFAQRHPFQGVCGSHPGILVKGPDSASPVTDRQDARTFVPAPASRRAQGWGSTRDFRVASCVNAPRWPMPKTGVTVLHRTRSRPEE